LNRANYTLKTIEELVAQYVKLQKDSEKLYSSSCIVPTTRRYRKGCLVPGSQPPWRRARKVEETTV
jgi:hypothetical protein